MEFQFHASILILSICLFCSCQQEQKAAAPQITIGALASLTGPASQQGQAWLRGAKLAQKEIAGSDRAVRLVVEDDQTDPAKAVSGFVSLTQISKAQVIIGGTWDYLGEAIYPIAQKYKVPILTPGNPPEVLSDAAKQNPYVFTNSITLAAESQALKKFLIKKNIARLALVYSDIPWGNVHAEMVKRLSVERNIELSNDEKFSLESYPIILKSIALKIKVSQPQAIFTTLDDAGLDTFLKELSQLDAHPLVINTQHLLTSYLISKDRLRFQNAYGIYPRLNSEIFEHKYLQEYGEDPPFLAAEGYDLVMFASNIFKDRGKLTRDDTYEHLGVKGSYRLPTTSGLLCEGSAIVNSLKDGKLQEED